MKKITTQTFDLFELIFSIVNHLYQCFCGKDEKEKPSQQALIDYDFVFGQIGKLLLFIIQIIYYLDYHKLDPVQTYLLIYGYYFFAIFIVLVEQRYIYKGYSYTYHRIVAYRIMNIVVNLITLWGLHITQSLLQNWENIKKKEFGTAEVILIGLVYFTVMEFLQLLFQLSTRAFSCMKKHDNTQEYDSKGGSGYLCFGQLIGMVVMGGSIILTYYEKKIPLSNLYQDLRIIVLEGSVALEFLFSWIFYCKSNKIKGIPRSKKVLCFGYGFCIGGMGIISGPAILVIVIIYGCLRTFLCCCLKLDFDLLICCWCVYQDKGHKYKASSVPIQTNDEQNATNERQILQQ
ncbi:unnamed protein product [Paramecium octaurelia]|uniref:Transmembrane protein n=1 Tax=Paramecium octaurelia TaxID=43137 RepID=A0A8S1WX70_PAROT|nr:unnamed protein product [Paramecium octaurelia]